jgi:2-phospho-L-lactate guanylyltransferase
MKNVWALLPVKALELSKTRLASVLQPQECALLSRAMFMDVLAAMDDAHYISNIAVLTNDADVAELTTQLGHLVIADQPEGELCAGLNTAAIQISALGADTVLVMPGDLPTVTAKDIDDLLARHQGGVSICPAIRDGGTNAIICSPPDALPFQFGCDSARKHLQEATDRGMPHARLPMHAFFRDIDTPDDLAWLARQDNTGNTVRFLHQSGIAARLGPGHMGAPT